MNIINSSNPVFTEACFKANKAFILDGSQPSPSIDSREEYYLSILEKYGMIHTGKTLVDLGAGFSCFSPVLSQLGLNVSIVDDFGGGGGVDTQQQERTNKIINQIRQQLGINVLEEDFLNRKLPFENESVDMVTCFHSLEHWHNSPKNLFHEIERILKPGGFVFFATPNSVNIRKRLWVLMGKSNLPKVEDWYGELPYWRGHVREPTIKELVEIFNWNGFKVVFTSGRNFYGRDSKSLRFLPRKIRHFLVACVGTVLPILSTLCTDIHIVGKKEVN
jgi:SAM-dependent methyltransferase